MQLADYLKKHNMTGSQLAAVIGCTESTINRLIPRPGKRQMRRPSLDLAQRIARATNNEVTPNDWPSDLDEDDDDAPQNGRAA